MVKFKFPVREIFTAVPETLNAFYKSYKEYEKISKFKKTRVLFCEKSGLIRGLDKPIYGDINTEKNLMRIRGVNAVYFVANLSFSDVLKEYVAIVPEQYYETLDYEKIAEFQRLEFLTLEKKPMTPEEVQAIFDECAIIQEFKLFKPKLSMNLAIDTIAMQNQAALDFSRYSEAIATSNAYKLLYTTPNKILILIGLIALFAGLLIGMIFSLTAYASLTIIKILLMNM